MGGKASIDFQAKKKLRQRQKDSTLRRRLTQLAGNWPLAIKRFNMRLSSQSLMAKRGKAENSGEIRSKQRRVCPV